MTRGGRGSQKRGKSLVIEDNSSVDAANLDMLVEAIQMGAGVGSNKRQRAESDERSDGGSTVPTEPSSSSALQVYQWPERAVVPAKSFQFSFEELSVLTRNEAYPYVDTSQLKTTGRVTISGAMFTRGAVDSSSKYTIDLSADGLRKLVDFPVQGVCTQIFSPNVIEQAFLKRLGQKYMKDTWREIAPWFGYSTTNSQARSDGWIIDDFRKFSMERHPEGPILDMRVRKIIRQVLRTIGKQSVTFCSSTVVLLAVAHVDPALPHLRHDWHAWVASEIRFRLGHPNDDKTSSAKFREGWGAIIEIVRSDFMACQAGGTKAPLYLEARNAFTDTRAEWDSQKCELVAERDQLKEELARAQERAAEAAERETHIRQEKLALEEEFSREKVEWEMKNQRLADEVSQLHEEKKKISGREESVQVELAQIRSLLEVTAKNTGDGGELKQKLEAKEDELKKLQEADRKIRVQLKNARKKGRDLEDELKTLLVGVLVKPEGKTLELMRSGKKWELNCYPQPFSTVALSYWKENACPVMCTFCNGLISPGTDLRIPTCGHSYHLSCVCASFGVNHLLCWAESCAHTLPTTWVQDFCLNREVDVPALKERYLCSWDIRCLKPNVDLFGEDEELQITGVTSMKSNKAKSLDALREKLVEKARESVSGSKAGHRLLFSGPPHRVPSTQFRLWSGKRGGIPVSDWSNLWSYPSSDFWVFSEQETIYDTANHNRCLMAVNVDCYRGDTLIQFICELNTVLCLRLRPWDGLFLEPFANLLVSLPWAADLLKSLVEKKFLTVWATGRIPLQYLQTPESFKTSRAHGILAPLFTSCKMWKCDHASASEPLESDHVCEEPSRLGDDCGIWLATRLWV